MATEVVIVVVVVVVEWLKYLKEQLIIVRGADLLKKQIVDFRR